jgi:hypothetical protein
MPQYRMRHTRTIRGYGGPPERKKSSLGLLWLFLLILLISLLVFGFFGGHCG